MRSDIINKNNGSNSSSSPSKKRRKDEQSPSRGTVAAATATGSSGMSSSSSKRSRLVVDGGGGSSNSYSAAAVAASTSSPMAMSKSGSRTASSSATGSSSTSSPELFFAEFCEIPFTLRTLLVEESSYITRKGFDSVQFPDHDLKTWHGRPARSVHVLPARVTVYQVLQQYQKKRTKNVGSSSSSSTATAVDKQKLRQVRKFVEGLAALFDDCLHKILLYPEERPQYEAIQHDEDLKLKRPCEIYGNTYLLRLMLRLPILLRAEPPQEMMSMGPMISDLIVLLQKNRLACFSKESYREPRHDELLPFEKKLADDYNHHNSMMMVMDVTSTSTAAHNDDDCNKSIMSET